MTAADRFELERFVEAQAHGVHERAAAELREGRKQGHWIWFELPQLRELGRSATAERYGIASLDEARAYLAHPVLGPRLRELAGIVETAGSADPVAMFGDVDAMKLRSSMTLFREAAEGEGKALFQAVLDRSFGGEADGATLRMLGVA